MCWLLEYYNYAIILLLYKATRFQYDAMIFNFLNTRVNSSMFSCIFVFSVSWSREIVPRM